MSQSEAAFAKFSRNMIGDHNNRRLTKDQRRRGSPAARDGPLVLVAFVLSAGLVFAFVAALVIWALE